MPDMETLLCETGQHEWKREKKRGKKPRSCPDHQLATPKLSPDEAARRRLEGRARANAERSKAGIQRVLAWSDWVVRDREITIQRALAASEGEPLPRRLPMPAIPSKPDYVAAAEAGVHSGVVEDAP